MDWQLAIEEERAALMRIVALLFSLANLAERAAGRSWPVRIVVLWWLRRAQVAALGLVDWPDMPASIGPPRTSPADALLLAVNLRDLACELEDRTNFAYAFNWAEPAERLELRVRLTRKGERFRNAIQAITSPAFCAYAARASPPCSSFRSGIPPPLPPPHKGEGNASARANVSDPRRQYPPPPCGEGLGVGVFQTQISQNLHLRALPCRDAPKLASGICRRRSFRKQT